MSNINPDPFTTRPEIEGTFGVVTSTHWIATAVGMGILEKGGNAFDAGVATAFTLQVVEPHLNGPGGDVPIIVHDTKRGRTEVICGQGPAPAKATIAHYKSEGLEMVPGTGLLAACVPGTFESWMLLLRDYGTMRLRDVLEPAIAYARDGYPLVERAAATIQVVEKLFRNHWTTSAAVYLPNNEVPRPGTLFTNKQLSETYARILKEAESAGSDRVAQIERARKSWSHGFVAEAIDKFCRTQEVMDVSGSPHRGVLSADDMARWQPTIEAPLTYDYGRYTVCKPGVWSQGPVMLQQLALLKGFELDGLDPAGPEFIHLQIECAKLAFADREKFYGDPKFTDIPIATLLSDAYNDERRKLISRDKASLDFLPGSVEGFGSVVKLRRAEGHRPGSGGGATGPSPRAAPGEIRARRGVADEGVDRGVLSGEGTEVRHEVGVGQEPHVEDQRGLGRKAVGEAEGEHVHRQAGRLGEVLGLFEDPLPELVHGQPGGVEDPVRPLADASEPLPLQPNSLPDGTLRGQGVRPSRLGKPADEDLVGGVEKEDAYGAGGSAPGGPRSRGSAGPGPRPLGPAPGPPRGPSSPPAPSMSSKNFPKRTRGRLSTQ